MKVLVIIVSYNFEPWIDRCLGSLRRSAHPADVMVIDNASTDETVRRIKAGYPEVRLVESPTNLGFGQANNIGLQTALDEGYDFVFLMNQDAWIEDETIGTLITLSRKYPEYGILSPVHLTGRGDRPDPGFGHYAGVQAISQLPTSEEMIPLTFVNAAFWMIPVPVLEKTGGFSPLFHHYGEDKDFVNRLHYHRYQVGYCPKVSGNHDREYRPVTHEGFLRTEYVYHLSEYANINHPWMKAFAYGTLAVWKKAAQALLKAKFSLSADYLRMSFRLLAQSRSVGYYREKNRMSYPNYITKP